MLLLVQSLDDGVNREDQHITAEAAHTYGAAFENKIALFGQFAESVLRERTVLKVIVSIGALTAIKAFLSQRLKHN